MVEFESAEQAAEAINTLHLSEVGRSQCWVCECDLQDTCSLHLYCGPALDLDEGLWHAGGWQGDLCQVCNAPLQIPSPGAVMMRACWACSSNLRKTTRCHCNATQTAHGLALAQGRLWPLELALQGAAAGWVRQQDFVCMQGGQGGL